MDSNGRHVDFVHLYLAVVTALAGTSILLLYLLYRVAVPEVFNAFLASPAAAVGNNPGVVALLVGALLVIGLLVVTVVAFGVRAANRAPADEGYAPHDRR